MLKKFQMPQSFYQRQLKSVHTLTTTLNSIGTSVPPGSGGPGCVPKPVWLCVEKNLRAIGNRKSASFFPFLVVLQVRLTCKYGKRQYINQPFSIAYLDGTYMHSRMFMHMEIAYGLDAKITSVLKQVLKNVDNFRQAWISQNKIGQV